MILIFNIDCYYFKQRAKSQQPHLLVNTDNGKREYKVIGIVSEIYV